MPFTMTDEQQQQQQHIANIEIEIGLHDEMARK